MEAKTGNGELPGWCRMSEPDPINPGYYKRGGIEVADIADAYDLSRWSFNAVKYILRAGRKDPATTIQDLEKSLWYVKREIERVRKEQTKS